MTRALAFGLGIGAAIQGFRQWPPDGPVSLTPACAVFVMGLLAAYFGGRRVRQAGGAVAVASASAAASGNTVNVQLFQPNAHPLVQSSVLDVRVPEPDSVPWLSAPRHAAIDADMLLDGVDLEELGLRETHE